VNRLTWVGDFLKGEDARALIAERDAALARAEAAEQKQALNERVANAAQDECSRLESEAASLRAEVAAYEANLVDTNELRAEVERLRAQLQDGDDADATMRDRHEATLKQLAAANALLERFLKDDSAPEMLCQDARAHLSGQAPARTDHERAAAVLAAADAWEAAPSLQVQLDAVDVLSVAVRAWRAGK